MKGMICNGTLALVASLAVGCSQSSAPDAAKQPAGAAAKSESGGPEVAIHKFMEAVRTGDEVTAANMLTPLARTKTTEAGLSVAPAASDTAKFKVGEVEYVADGAAHVGCELTDLDDEGQPHTSKIIWVARREKEGWRIAGMATKVFPDELPVILNFEDPADMERKQKLVEQEISRRNAAQAKGEKPKDESLKR